MVSGYIETCVDSAVTHHFHRINAVSYPNLEYALPFKSRKLKRLRNKWRLVSVAVCSNTIEVLS